MQGLTDDDIYKKLFLVNTCSENLNVLNFECNAVWNPTFVELIEKFSTWRLGWYLKRYENLATNISKDIQKFNDILTAITNNVGMLARKVKDKDELKELLDTLNIVNVDYISELPVYRFTEIEKNKVEEKLEEALKTLEIYNKLIASESLRKSVYISELEEILISHKKGKYKTKE